MLLDIQHEENPGQAPEGVRGGGGGGFTQGYLKTTGWESTFILPDGTNHPENGNGVNACLATDALPSLRKPDSISGIQA